MSAHVQPKSPGQVAFEKFREVFVTGTLPWERLSPKTRQQWEAVAAAVRAAK